MSWAIRDLRATSSARYVEGREAADYAKLLARAGLVLRKRNPGRAWWGDVAFDGRSGVVRVGAGPSWASPVLRRRPDLDDQIIRYRWTTNPVASGESGPRSNVTGPVIPSSWPSSSIALASPKTARVACWGGSTLELIPTESAGGGL